MHEKDTKRIVREQPKKKHPNWKRIFHMITDTFREYLPSVTWQNKLYSDTFQHPYMVSPKDSDSKLEMLRSSGCLLLRNIYENPCPICKNHSM